MLSIPLWSFYGLCHVLSFKSSLFPLPRLSCRRAVLVRHLASLSSLFLPALFQVCLFLSCFLFGYVHVESWLVIIGEIFCVGSVPQPPMVYQFGIPLLLLLKSSEAFLVTVMEGSMLTFAYVK